MRLATPLLVLVTLVTLAGCGGGPPRRPVPPDQREGGAQGTVIRERFRVRDIADEWHDGLTLIDGLKRHGGVEDCFRDRTDGSFVVVYNSQRTHRDELTARIIQLGRDEGREWDPLWEDR